MQCNNLARVVTVQGVVPTLAASHCSTTSLMHCFLMPLALRMSFFALRMKSCLILVLLLMASTATSAADDGGSLLLTISSGTMPIESLAFSPDGLQIVAPYDTTGARVYSTETGDMIHHLTHTTDVKAVAFSKDGKLIATVDTTFHTKFWDAETGMQVQTFLGTYLPMKIVFSPAGNHLAMVTPTGVQIYDINTGIPPPSEQ